MKEQGFDFKIIVDGLKAYSTTEERNKAIRIVYRLDSEYPKILARLRDSDAMETENKELRQEIADLKETYEGGPL